MKHDKTELKMSEIYNAYLKDILWQLWKKATYQPKIKLAAYKRDQKWHLHVDAYSPVAPVLCGSRVINLSVEKTSKLIDSVNNYLKLKHGLCKLHK